MRRHIAELAAGSYFASGLSDPGEVRGVTLAGYHIGISCSELRPRLLEEVEACVREHSVRVFVDSGAFSEVAVVDGALVTVRPLSSADWERRLAVYERLARSCGANAYLVAPDKVGDQRETLARLERYAPRLRALRLVHGDAWFGPHLIVPVQRGELSMAEFAARACGALGLGEDEVVWGIPMKKGATPLRELTLFARRCPPDAAFHLLGMGPSSPRFEAVVLSLLAECPEARITCDAVRVTALVGRGDGGGARPLTAAQDAVRREEPGAASSRVKRVALERVLGAESLALLLDNGWMDPELPAFAVVVQEANDQMSFFASPS